MKKDEFCKKLKQARQESKMTQGDVAKKLGIPLSAVSLMEAGERKVDIFELLELLKVYNKDVSYFFADENTPKVGRRWYDNDPVISRAIALLEQASPQMQKASAMGVIGFLQEVVSGD